MATRCSLFFIYIYRLQKLLHFANPFNRKASIEGLHYINFDYEYSLWLDSTLRLVFVFTQKSMGKDSLATPWLRLRVDRPTTQFNI